MAVWWIWLSSGRVGAMGQSLSWAALWLNGWYGWALGEWVLWAKALCLTASWLDGGYGWAQGEWMFLGKVCVEVLCGWTWLSSEREWVLWGKVSVVLLCGWMVDMVELWESGCYGEESLWKGLWFGGMVSLWHWVCQRAKSMRAILNIELGELFNVLLIRWYYWLIISDEINCEWFNGEEKIY